MERLRERLTNVRAEIERAQCVIADMKQLVHEYREREERICEEICEAEEAEFSKDPGHNPWVERLAQAEAYDRDSVLDVARRGRDTCSRCPIYVGPYAATDADGRLRDIVWAALSQS